MQINGKEWKEYKIDGGFIVEPYDEIKKNKAIKKCIKEIKKIAKNKRLVFDCKTVTLDELSKLIDKQYSELTINHVTEYLKLLSKKGN